MGLMEIRSCSARPSAEERGGAGGLARVRSDLAEKDDGWSRVELDVGRLGDRGWLEDVLLRTETRSLEIWTRS